MKRTCLVGLLVLTAFSLGMIAQQAAQPSRLVDRTFGYTIDIPDFGDGGVGTEFTRLAFSAPPIGNITPNVNIIVQNQDFDLQAHLEQTRRELDQLGLRIDHTKFVRIGDHDAVRLGYSGNLQDTDLAFKVLIVFLDQRVLIVTCTGPKPMPQELDVAFTTALDSFRLTE